MRRVGESECDYQQRVLRDGYDREDKFGGMGTGIGIVGTGIMLALLNAFTFLLLLLPEVILFPVLTIVLVQLFVGFGARVVQTHYYLTYDIMLLSILGLIWYLKNRFKGSILREAPSNYKIGFLAEFLYSEGKQAKRRRAGVYFFWIILFVWLCPY